MRTLTGHSGSSMSWQNRVSFSWCCQDSQSPLLHSSPLPLLQSCKCPFRSPCTPLGTLDCQRVLPNFRQRKTLYNFLQNNFACIAPVKKMEQNEHFKHVIAVQEICLLHVYIYKQLINSTDRCNKSSCVNSPEHTSLRPLYFHTAKYMTCSMFAWGLFMCVRTLVGRIFRILEILTPESVSLYQSRLKACILHSEPDMSSEMSKPWDPLRHSSHKLTQLP